MVALLGTRREDIRIILIKEIEELFIVEEEMLW